MRALAIQINFVKQLDGREQSQVATASKTEQAFRGIACIVTFVAGSDSAMDASGHVSCASNSFADE